MRLLRFARNDENSKIPYRDPRVKSEDDIVGNSRIPKAKSRIPRQKLLGILEFLKHKIIFQALSEDIYCFVKIRLLLGYCFVADNLAIFFFF